jgi:hypothetical protein
MFDTTEGSCSTSRNSDASATSADMSACGSVATRRTLAHADRSNIQAGISDCARGLRFVDSKYRCAPAARRVPGFRGSQSRGCLLRVIIDSPTPNLRQVNLRQVSVRNRTRRRPAVGLPFPRFTGARLPPVIVFPGRRASAPVRQGWRTFVHNYADAIASIDMFVVPTISFGVLYGLLILRQSRRELLWLGMTADPNAQWLARQLTEASGSDEPPRGDKLSCPRASGVTQAPHAARNLQTRRPNSGNTSRAHCRVM